MRHTTPIACRFHTSILSKRLLSASVCSVILLSSIDELRAYDRLQPKLVSTFRIYDESMNVAPYDITRNGVVYIDWKAVERLATSRIDAEGNIARLMLAVRNGTWKVKAAD